MPTHPMHSNKGHVVRIFWNTSFNKVYSNFYWLMREEANPVSIQGDSKIIQLPHIYYWKGSVVTYSYRYDQSELDRGVIEIQHFDKGTLDSLVGTMITELERGAKTKLRYETVVGDAERAEKRASGKVYKHN